MSSNAAEMVPLRRSSHNKERSGLTGALMNDEAGGQPACSRLSSCLPLLLGEEFNRAQHLVVGQPDGSSKLPPAPLARAFPLIYLQPPLV